jgi:hypothetical protein
MNNETANQYMFLVSGSPCQQGHLTPEQMQVHVKESNAWMDDLIKRGVITIAQPLTRERKIVSASGVRILSDGVHAESKEVIGGFYIINVPTMDEAVAVALSCPQLKHGTQFEVRRIAELQLTQTQS